MKRIVFLPVIILLVLSACIETEPVSPVPEIEFISLEVAFGIDELGNLKPIGELVFSFSDGDADMGQFPENISPPIIIEIDTITGDTTFKSPWIEDDYNVFTTPYYKSDTNYFRIEVDTNVNPPPWYYLWHNSKLDRVGQNKTVKGKVTIKLEDMPTDYDTIRYDFYIVDRAGNKSNMETTSDVGTHVEEEPSNFGL